MVKSTVAPNAAAQASINEAGVLPVKVLMQGLSEQLFSGSVLICSRFAQDLLFTLEHLRPLWGRQHTCSRCCTIGVTMGSSSSPKTVDSTSRPAALHLRRFHLLISSPSLSLSVSPCPVVLPPPPPLQTKVRAHDVQSMREHNAMEHRSCKCHSKMKV